MREGGAARQVAAKLQVFEACKVCERYVREWVVVKKQSCEVFEVCECRYIRELVVVKKQGSQIACIFKSHDTSYIAAASIQFR